MQTFREYLRDDAKVPESLIERYVKWAEDYDAWVTAVRITRPGHPIVSAAFFNKLATKVSADKVVQARRAVHLHVVFASRSHLSPAPPISPPPRKLASLQGRDVLEELKKCIRFRHLSYRTEQAYIGWADRFIRFVREGSSTIISEKDLKEFLTYLAVNRKVRLPRRNRLSMPFSSSTGTSSRCQSSVLIRP